VGRRIGKSGPANNPLTALRTVDYVSDAVNSKIRHCFTHTITHKDEYQRDFESICDTVVKIRTFYADHLIHGNISINELAQDTLIVTPIHFDSIKFPDTLFALKCGILANQDYPPEDIAEYLYHTYKHFNYQDRNVVLDYNPVTAEYVEGSPCITFADQYKSQEHSKYLQWNKVFQHSDYNNWGVRKAFPFINRHSKTIDKKLKEKLVSAGADQTNDTDLWTLNEVSVPISLTICNIIASYSDVHKIEGCSGELTIYRTWHLLDWCTAQSKEHTQIIKIIDNQPPQILSLNGKSLSLDGHFSDDFYFGRYIQNDQIENDDLKDDTISHNENVKVEVPGYGMLGVHWINISEPWGCIATYTFPAPDLVDHCSESSFAYELLDDNWNSNGKTYTSGESVNINWIDNESLTHPIVKLRAWDECGNELEYFYYLKAIDKFPPAVVLYDSLVVTLTYEKGANGTAKVRCIDVNAGSHDGDCGDIKCHIRTSDNEVWGDSLHFSCDDIGHVEVQVRITDYSGNTSTGITSVHIKNEQPNIISCEDVFISCTDPTHPEWIGEPHILNICSSPEIEYFDDYHLDDLCYTGYIDRTWTIIGTNVSCAQRITISSTVGEPGASALNPESIQWPMHNNGKTLLDGNWNTDWIEVYEKGAHDNCNQIGFNAYADETPGESSPSSTERADALKSLSFDDNFECELGSLKEPIWSDPACGLVAKTFEDQQVNFNDGACLKVLRTWTVIDWCVYDPKIGDKYPEDYFYVVNGFCQGKDYIRTAVATEKRDGYYTYIQEILVIDQTRPQFDDEKRKVEVAVGAGSKTDENACEIDYTITRSAYDECLDTNLSDIAEDGTNSEGPEIDWYVKLVKIENETGAEKPQVIHPAFGLNWFPLAQGGNEVGHEGLYSDDNESGSASFTFTGAADETFHVKWRIEDGCNNPNEIVDVVTFFDAKAPVLQCYGNLSTNVMNTNGEIEIWANDFGEAFDCDGNEVSVWFKNEDDELIPSLTLSCGDLEGNAAVEKKLDIYAIDESENESFCSVILRIADGNNVCGNGDVSGAAIISGNVATYIGDMSEFVEVTMGDETKMTGIDGGFAFENNPMGLDYRLVANKNDNYLNGVSTLDLVLIQKHILGLDLLDSPYKVIAADINNDEKVSSIDLVELRKLILDIISELPNNKSWRFVDANQSFADILNPFPVNENIEIDFLLEDIKKDFISIKIGDVNGNASPNSLITGSRINSSTKFTTLDQEISSGDLVSITFASSDFVDMNAFQFTLNVSGLEFVGIQSGAIEMSNQNIAVFGDALTVAWTSVVATSSEKDLFTIDFRALADIRLSNSISMTSSRTDARAYNSKLEKSETTLTFNSEDGSTIATGFELMQNSPNPFQNTTAIGFELGESGPATLTVFDVTGKTIREVKAIGERGYNEIILTKSDLGTSGVLYYQKYIITRY